MGGGTGRVGGGGNLVGDLETFGCSSSIFSVF